MRMTYLLQEQPPRMNMIFSCSYNDDRHEDFVTGLAWHPISHQLLSCGWDRQVFAHSIQNKM